MQPAPGKLSRGAIHNASRLFCQVLPRTPFSGRVTLSDQSVYEADVVGFDSDKDVAVLHIDAPASKLRPLKVGSSSDLLVGQKVFAIGNPVSGSAAALLCTAMHNAICIAATQESITNAPLAAP